MILSEMWVFWKVYLPFLAFIHLPGCRRSLYQYFNVSYCRVFVDIRM